MWSCFEGLLERDTVVQSEFEFDIWFKNHKFLSFEVVCTCHCYRGGEGQFRLLYDTANIRHAVIKSLPLTNG